LYSNTNIARVNIERNVYSYWSDKCKSNLLYKKMCIKKDISKASDTYSFIGVISWDCCPFALLLEAPICAKAD